MHPNMSLLVKNEIEKYIKVGFIDSIDYSPWLLNVVPTIKLRGEVRYYMDFSNINKSCPKENFHLPHIDMIIDSIVGYEALLFIDGFSAYD